MEIVSRSPSAVIEAHVSPPNSQSRNLGGWRAIMYILVVLLKEMNLSRNWLLNMTIYLSQKYNLSGVFLTNVVNIWSGSTNLTSILGVVAFDAYLGKFHTLLWGTLCSLLGMSAMTLKSAVPPLRPLSCKDEAQCIEPRTWQLVFLFTSLAFISMGAGGIPPSNIAFGADQFDTNTKKGKAQLESFFNWWYLSFTIALIIALAGVVCVQTNVSWTIGFTIPNACLMLSITIFLIGRPTYFRKKPDGSVFLDLFKVIPAAYGKRQIILQPEGTAYYNPPHESERDEALDSIEHESLNWLNKAALITDESEVDPQGRVVDSWRLCSLRQVKTLKSLV